MYRVQLITWLEILQQANKKKKKYIGYMKERFRKGNYWPWISMAWHAFPIQYPT